MWWTQGVTVALCTVTVFGAIALGSGRRWAPMALWLALMVGATGWYAWGAWKLADGLSSLGNAFGSGRTGERGAAESAPSFPSTTPSGGAAPPAEVRWPRRLSEFPVAGEGPVQAVLVSIQPGDFGLGKSFRMRLTNTDPTRVVDGVRFEVWCFNNFGDLVRNPQSFGERPSFGMISQDRITSAHPENGAWRVAFGAEQCTQGRSWVTQVHFADGTVWENPASPTRVSP